MGLRRRAAAATETTAAFCYTTAVVSLLPGKVSKISRAARARRSGPVKMSLVPSRTVVGLSPPSSPVDLAFSPKNARDGLCFTVRLTFRVAARCTSDGNRSPPGIDPHKLTGGCILCPWRLSGRAM